MRREQQKRRCVMNNGSEEELTEGTDTSLKEIAAVLRSTENMAGEFAKRVQDRMGEPVPHDEILSAMKKMSARQLSMDKVITKIVQQRK